MSNSRMYDVCIVGAGMWGATAARHASKQTGLKVCVVGPEEPTLQEFADSEVFGAHYDAGRIYTTVQGSDTIGRIRGLVSQRSIERFAEVEELSGISFHEECGFIFFGEVDAFYDSIPEGLSLETAVSIRGRYPYLDTGMDGPTAIFAKRNSGYLNARKYVQAQLLVARRQGCDIINAVVSLVTEDDQSVSGGMQVKTESGRCIMARKVLLCTGAFTPFKDLLPPGLQLDATVTSDITIRFELDDEDIKRLHDMPCLTSEFSKPSPRECYILPPIRYPDAKVYIKIGHGQFVDTTLDTHEEVRRWYIDEADAKVVDILKDIFHSVVQGVKPLSEIYYTCADLDTPTRLPYCDMVSPGLGVLVGGNSLGATMAEEMGRMGADMITGEANWNRDIPKEVFKARYTNK
ncbi:uncharacterized protein LOC110986037 [Acanthaster planci]|uniref:Uncharacterized protein LOC110986037 n=1 Tax=Acanthaster planci TaxID=133434 RepID=A0A8B7ZEN3_ACAPL|nr:uncharacterized protein LOC110986037 [Acanthaster planci]XP_022103316.1 uncharacterized protein LOC110986037 [Acanthaster planci]XP_022103317.1 uncharacterized protein LOC110986037 [Acanthaster planci]XP_022103318.1 uncharacterized protein LOC110986037 [Acanthaster planci]